MEVVLDPVDSVSVTTLVDNVVDSWLENEGPARRPARRPGWPRLDAPLLDVGTVADPLQAEHGFSALVTVRKAGREHCLLFDAGRSPYGLVENMRRLDIAPDRIETIVFSHGHYDHTTGLEGLVRVLGPSNVPIMIHPDFWSRRRMVFDGLEPFELPTTSKRGLEDVGFTILEERRPSFLLDGSVLITGEIDRTTEFERGLHGHETCRGGVWVSDPLILDDQALVMHVRGKGLVILTGCSHAGVVNTVRCARRITRVDHIYALIGGFHLSGYLFEPLIPRVCAELAQLCPTVIVPTHCTGWRATHALASKFPQAFIQNSVGTSYEL